MRPTPGAHINQRKHTMDMEQLMAQAQSLQEKISAAQDTLAASSVKGIAGNGDCIVDMSGKYDMLGISINPQILARGADAVNAAVMAAYNDAKQKADALIDKVMGDATAGMPMPN